jgi:hypothetical protein
MGPRIRRDDEEEDWEEEEEDWESESDDDDW